LPLSPPRSGTNGVTASALCCCREVGETGWCRPLATPPPPVNPCRASPRDLHYWQHRSASNRASPRDRTPCGTTRPPPARSHASPRDHTRHETAAPGQRPSTNLAHATDQPGNLSRVSPRDTAPGRQRPQPHFSRATRPLSASPSQPRFPTRHRLGQTTPETTPPRAAQALAAPPGPQSARSAATPPRVTAASDPSGAAEFADAGPETGVTPSSFHGRRSPSPEIDSTRLQDHPYNRYWRTPPHGTHTEHPGRLGTKKPPGAGTPGGFQAGFSSFPPSRGTAGRRIRPVA
jgi:hypothetical protein